MVTLCPSCQQPFHFSEEQLSRIEQALYQLSPGQLLSLKCPHCREQVTLDKAGFATSSAIQRVKPPPPPSLDWLETGIFQAEEKVEDVPMALVLSPPGDQCRRIAEALEAVGYQVFLSSTVEDALERLQFVSYSCIAFQVDLDGGVDASSFHAFMRNLAMDRRRFLFYILIGDQFHTLYDLEALTCSANLTVNTADLKRLDLILRKAIPAYEALFGPFLEEHNAYGKR